jgi:hypothetical protein
MSPEALLYNTATDFFAAIAPLLALAVGLRLGGFMLFLVARAIFPRATSD